MAGRQDLFLRYRFLRWVRNEESRISTLSQQCWLPFPVLQPKHNQASRVMSSGTHGRHTKLRTAFTSDVLEMRNEVRTHTSTPSSQRFPYNTRFWFAVRSTRCSLHPYPVSFTTTTAPFALSPVARMCGRPCYTNFVTHRRPSSRQSPVSFALFIFAIGLPRGRPLSIVFACVRVTTRMEIRA